MSATRAAAAGILALLALGLGCHKEPATTEQAPPPPVTAAPPSEPAPPDHLAPGELLEGTDVAFGVRLPRDLHLEQAFVDVAYARGFAPVHSLVQYFRARLREGDLHEGEKSATFEHVRAMAKPDRELSVRIVATVRGMSVVFRDTTPPRPSDLPNDEARLRAVGLTPDGRWLDPTHLN